MALNNFFTRAIAGAVYVALITLSLYLGNVSFGLLCLSILVLSCNEFYAMVRKLKLNPMSVMATSLAGIAYIILILYKNNIAKESALYLCLLFFIILMTAEMLGNTRNAVYNFSMSSLCMVYILLPLVCLYQIGFYEKFSFGFNFSHEILLGFFILNWTGDTGAYLAGSTFGRTKLLEKISPKKTVEGSAGGLVLTVLIACLLAGWLGKLPLLDWIIVSVLINITGSLGDLFESLIKRKVEVKDSGNIIPGHGGMLDRIDSVLFSAPAVFVYLNAISS